MIDKKGDNQKFMHFESGLLRIWDNLTAVETEDGIQYEGELYETYASEGCDVEAILAQLKATELANEARCVREKRSTLIANVTWRYERYAREMRLGLATTDDIGKLDAYIQLLCDIPDQAGFPHDVVWPVL